MVHWLCKSFRKNPRAAISEGGISDLCRVWYIDRDKGDSKLYSVGLSSVCSLSNQ